MGPPAYKFLVDRMLGRLIAWLRICGYDTKSALDLEPTPNEDTLLIDMAKKGERILISRDRNLVDRAKKAGVEAVLVNSDDVKAQLEGLVKLYGINVEPVIARCTVCNSMLRKATQADMEKIRTSGEVPEQLINDHTELWVCDNCGKVYWQGSHWRNILRTAEEVKSAGNKTNQQ